MQLKTKNKMEVMSETKTEIIFDNGTSEETIETSIDLPELNLVRMDMNVIEYPLFSKNKRRKVNQSIRYKLNGRTDKYIEVKPIAGETIPGDFEEKVFIALISVMRKNNYSRNFAVTISEIADNMKVSAYSKKAIHNQIKMALKKLSETSYTFKDSLYSSIKNELLTDTIITNMMSVRILSKADAGIEEKEKYFKDGRIKEIYLIAISQHFYDNIINKGYLVFDSNLLLNIGSSIARAIHMLITKLRFNNFSYKIGLISLAGRIPLKVDKNNIGRSAKSIEKACEELKDKKLIEDFKFIKNKNWENTEIEFFFTEEHNKIKQDNFYVEKNIFKELYLNVQDTNSENVSENFFNFSNSNEASEENIEKILSALPAKAKQLKTIKNLICNSIIQYDFDRVLRAAIYTKEKNPNKVYGYFKKAISFNYGASISLKKEHKKEKNVEQHKLNLENLKNNMVVDYYPYYESFEKLDLNVQKQICNMIIKESILRIENNSSLNESFKNMFIESIHKQFEVDKKRLVNEFLEKNKDKFENLLNKKSESQKIEEELNIQEKKVDNISNSSKKDLLDITNIKDYITKSIEGYAAITLLDTETEKNLRKELSLKIIPLMMESPLSKKDVDEIIKEEIKKL